MILNGVLLILLAVLLANLFESFARREAFNISEWTWATLSRLAFNLVLGLGVVLIVVAFLLVR